MNNKLRKIARFPMLLAILIAVIIPPIGISIVLGFPVNWAWSKVLETWVKAVWTWTTKWVQETWTSIKNWATNTELWESIKAWVTKTWTSIKDWDTELSEFYIVTIITLFIICLILLLLKKHVESIRKSLSNIQEKIGEAFQGESLPWKETFIESLKLAFYPLHFALRLIALFLLLLAILSAVFPSLIPIVVSIFFLASNPKIPESNSLLIMVISLIATIGLVSLMLQKSVDAFKKYLSCIIKENYKVFWPPPMPEIDIGQSLVVTWRCYVAKVGKFMSKTFTQSRKLIMHGVVLGIIVLCGYVSAKTAKETIIEKEFTERILEKEFIAKEFIAIVRDTILILDSKMLRDSMMTKLDPIEIKVDRWVMPAPKELYLFEKGAQFSLAYASQGSLSTKTGICPEGSNEEWLKLFKGAILECSKEEQVKLKIQGFASVAPVGPDSAKSDTLNYQIANQRAEALIYFLMLPPDSIYTKTKCKDVLDNISIWERKKENGTSVKPDSLWWKNSWGVTVSTEKVSNEEVNSESKSQLRFTFSVSNSATGGQKQKGLDVIYEPWQNHEEMKGTKPTDDGSLPKPRHYPLEFLNRTVQIIIEEGGCLTKEVPTVPKAEDNAGESD